MYYRTSSLVNRLVLQITYWPTSDTNSVQTKDVILSNVQLCRPMDPNSVYARRRRRAVGSPVSNRVTDLKPYKQYSATVSVLNLGQSSDASDPVTFMTSEHGTVQVFFKDLFELSVLVHDVRLCSVE